MAVLDPRPVGGVAEGVPPRACCAPSHQLWARTAQERCKGIFVSSAAAVNALPVLMATFQCRCRNLLVLLTVLNSKDSTLDVESSRGHFYFRD
uniref:Uncharacterized protein n=1 Tax=Hyaloperonospora arabidopsidis (strain Emoy2) TaxID=559515 RepID=M4BMD7_HYAAE